MRLLFNTSDPAAWRSASGAPTPPAPSFRGPSARLAPEKPGWTRASFLSGLPWTFCLLLVWGWSVRGADLKSAFSQANRLYEEGKFKNAAEAYEKLAQAGQVSVALYFNLGNAWFKSGQVGRAIVAYRQAETLSPRDPDVQANLKFARDNAGGAPLRQARRREELRRLTLNEWAALAMGAGWIWLGLLTAREVRPDWRPWLRGYTAATGTAAVLLIACLADTWHDRISHETAVVVVRDAVVRYGPLDEAQSAYVVHDGSELAILDRSPDWLEVRDGNQRTGWLRQSQVLVPNGSSARGSGSHLNI